jgi:hypothetical protein
VGRKERVDLGVDLNPRGLCDSLVRKRRRAAKAAGVEAPTWALQPIPEVVVVGPRIGDVDPQ